MDYCLWPCEIQSERLPSGLPLWPPVSPFLQCGLEARSSWLRMLPSCSRARPSTREDLTAVAFQSVTVTYFISLTESLTKFCAVLISLALMYKFCQHFCPPVWSTNLVNDSCQQYILVNDSSHKCLIVCFSGFPLFPTFPLLYYMYLGFLS